MAADRRQRAWRRATFLSPLVSSPAALFAVPAAAMAAVVHRALAPFRSLRRP
ncbi:hypothetical protein [Methylobacterium indicum]|uniref:hypothetical protein n=1 Tax=Methylobacterium indicum TaxID=1775910 RepID=UPI001A9252C6|nr:hypothetical protein [Methylobacterium indicum]